MIYGETDADYTWTSPPSRPPTLASCSSFSSETSTCCGGAARQPYFYSGERMLVRRVWMRPQVTCFVHGVGERFLEVGDLAARGGGGAFTKGAYFIGKAVWGKVRSKPQWHAADTWLRASLGTRIPQLRSLHKY